MGDAAIGVVTETVLNMVVSLATEEISLAWDVEKELKKLAKQLELIQALLSDAQSKQITSQFVQLWLKKLRSIALDGQIVLDEFGYQVLRQKIEGRKSDKVRSCFSSSNPICFRPKIAHKIKDVLSSLEELYTESNQIGLQALQLVDSPPDPKEMRLTVPYVEDSKIVGRDEDTAKVIDMLIGCEYKEDLPVITILGMGGQGKTTLAQLVYNNNMIKSHFDKRVWVYVSQEFSVERLLGQMFQSLTETNCHLTNVEALVNKLREQLRSKRHLLVLDDVWNNNGEEWDRMKTCLLGIGSSKESKILVTTRSENVASIMRTSGLHRLDILSEDQSWELFEKCAFAEGGATRTPQLEELGKRILKRCGGVPLAIKTIGGLLYSKNSESEWSMIERSETWAAYSEANRVLSAIKLSYDHLPSLSLKQCFAYCAILDKDAVLEKDQLIQLWMAQGLLNPPKGSHLQMEDMGNIYFHILLRNSLFQDPEKDRVNNIRHCKMHNLVHDVSLQVSENYCHNMKDSNVEGNEIEAVHVSINSGEKKIWKSLKGILPSKLRTLYLKGSNLLEHLFASFTCLNVLIVEDKNARKLPNEIGTMIHLRFLDICGTSIERLPKSFTKLYYLQTLRVHYLTKVPKGFVNLINLRQIHMDMNPSNIFFPGLGQLTNLQTLSFFEVGRDDGYQIEELENLHNLRGTLRILGLQNVGSYESAAKSNLSKKSNIQTLELNWDRREEDCDDTDVMEGLKPHPSLKSLKIVGYTSPKFPSWMVAKNDLLLLRNLVTLCLCQLDKCERLPSLGDLPCLECLEMESLPNVKCVGKEFYGWSNLDWETKSSTCGNGQKIITLFPVLRRLQLWRMQSVVEWSDAIGIIPTTDSSSSTSSLVKVFPRLEDLDIDSLPNLSVFPNLGSLPSLERLRVINCQNLIISSSDWNRCLGSPQRLEIDDHERHSPVIVDDADIHYFPLLRELWIIDCDKFTAPFCSLQSLVALGSLFMESNPSLWPKDLHHLINLRELRLGAGGDFEELELDCLPWPFPTISNATCSHFVSLTSLTLRGFRLPKVTSLPDQIQYVTTLRNLRIDHFDGLEDLPEWLGNLRCLQNLTILDCMNLKSLPSAESFQSLSNLQIVEICNCPLLAERCEKGSGSVWPKISHIPNVDYY